MRKWHRLMAPFFAFFLVIISVTGVAVQMTDLLDTPKESKAQVNAARKHAVVDSAASVQEPKERESSLRRWGHWLKKLHSGESLGPAGLAVSILSGIALLFFAASGLWMYIQIPLRRWQRRQFRQ